MEWAHNRLGQLQNSECVLAAPLEQHAYSHHVCTLAHRRFCALSCMSQNPLQAMDRAHRLGQRRTVNVYRLLTRDSLEDKIMGLQRFKLDVANSVVNQDNVSLKTMDAGRLLDLFTLDQGDKAAAPASRGDTTDTALAQLCYLYDCMIVDVMVLQLY